MNRNIEHNPQQQRFQWIEDGILCVLDYELANQVLTIIRTSVPKAVGGRGIAADLTKQALNTAREMGWLVRPICSYAVAYIKRNPQYQTLLA